jgi:hypothetical protein
VKTEHEIHELTQQANTQSSPIEAFAGLALGESPGTSETPAPAYNETSREPPMWNGYVLYVGYPDEYVQHRNQFATAAYQGNWEQIWRLLAFARETYRESWINCHRLSQFLFESVFALTLIAAQNQSAKLTGSRCGHRYIKQHTPVLHEKPWQG